MRGALTMLLSAEEIAACVGGTVERTAAMEACGVSTDSRTTGKGELFVALRGPRFDGHGFVDTAFSRGAWGAMVEGRAWAEGSLPLRSASFADRAVVTVGDTEKGLGDLASCHRADLQVQVVGVTGSNGKTTTKEMIAAIAARRWRVHKNPGNLNNLIGLPLTVLALDETHEVAVLEMGMNHRGEIRRLAQIARPGIGVITNVGPAHIEHLGSLDGVAAAKGELVESLDPDGTAVLNGDDPMTPGLAARARGGIVTFGLRPGADVSAEQVRHLPGGTAFTLCSPAGKAAVVLPMIGGHNVSNALAASAAALALGASTEDIVEGLGDVRPAPMRFSVVEYRGGIRIVNDAYNANPESMRASLSAFALLGGARRRAAVLGDMRELGEETASAHRLLGGEASSSGLDLLVAVGEFASEVAAGAAGAGMDSERIVTAGDAAEAAGKLRDWLQGGDLVLFKGSRAVGLEQAIEKLRRDGTLVEREG